MIRYRNILLAGLLLAGPAVAAPRQPPSVAEWIAMTPQQRMALREETRSWDAGERRAFWSRFDDELKAMKPSQRQALSDQAAAQMRAQVPAAAPETAPPAGKLPKAIALPPPGDLTGQPD
ncbi:MAG TPA: hypothetical protein VGV37_07950 [Aliidongia sp.]|uniref:hypothetical protein n=1 Tax=Aliidongia sp. TaxID=1914230 RepID=UPI002DDD8E55|nr:hypothetical protein [Aliidongia sp.]HEV2674458.1 hypothetical protein [Aliidongia sp.]